MPRSRTSPERPAGEGAKPCDGTVQDYRRHSWRGEEPCAASKEAWRAVRRVYRHTGIYEEGLDLNKAHPFMFRKPKTKNKKRNGVYHGKDKSKSKGRS